MNFAMMRVLRAKPLHLLALIDEKDFLRPAAHRYHLSNKYGVPQWLFAKAN